MSTTPRRVIFTGDFLRPSPFRMRPTQHHNIRWLHDILSKQITQATGLPCEFVAWRADGMGSGLLDDGAIATLYSWMGETSVSIEGWARLYDGNVDIPAYIISYFDQLFGSSIVIGFELSKFIKRVLDIIGVKHIDVNIHAARFMDDLCLSFYSDSLEVQSILSEYQIRDQIIEQFAGLAAAAARRGRAEDVPANSCLFVAQTSFDKSLIRERRILSLADVAEIALETWERFDHVLVKAHPLEPQAPAVAFALALSPKTSLTDAGIYSILASENLSLVSTMSSGVGLEASFFGKPATYFCKPDTTASDSNDYLCVLHDFLDADFWRAVLSPLVVTRPVLGSRIPFKPNRLRMSLKSNWGYQD
jgi:hypothetical protein